MANLKYGVNSVVQYNQANDLMALGYVLDNSVALAKFLTNAPDVIPLQRSQRAALYFLVGDVGDLSVYYDLYNSQGILYSTQSFELFLGGIELSLPVNLEILSNTADLAILGVRIGNGIRDYTETKKYRIKDDCNLSEIWWLNNKGGMDSYCFISKPIESLQVNRGDNIKYSQETNNFSPDRIYKQTITQASPSFRISVKCENIEQAQWLKEDILSSVDVYIRESTYYLPLLVVQTTVSVSKALPDCMVTFDFAYAFDRNTQR